MPIKILMPALSPTMTEGNLLKWLKKEGDNVQAGQTIAEIETDKATMEVEAVDEGILGKILVPAGTKAVQVNTVIGLILEEGEDKSALNNISEPIAQAVAKPEQKAESKKPTQEPKTTIQSTNEQRTFASPFAKKLASENRINLSTVQGSGPQGRVVKTDILSAMQPKLGSKEVVRMEPEQTELPLSSMREIIAKRLVEAKQQVPHFYLSMDCNISKLLEMREEINTATDKERPAWKISVNDLVIKAVALALRSVPEANASWNDKAIIQYNNVDISVAVAIKDGLITPIIRNADQKTIFVISQEMKDLANKARQGTLKPIEFQGGSASVSNLGMYGIKQFNAIVNPPQSCIFAIGAGHEVPAVIQGKVQVTTVMNVTLSCDHRVVDGAVGARVLQSFKEHIENPSRLLL